MAVGIIVKCDKCGDSYDSGKTGHWFDCDGGAKIKAAQESLDKFNAMPVNIRLQFLYKELQELKELVNNMSPGEILF